jgi:endogenous inhibitor of DNA gyrase (YacG/DUF329 family)
MATYSRRCHYSGCGKAFEVASLNDKRQFCSADCRIAALHEGNQREKRKA